MKYQDFSFLYKVISSPRALKILFFFFTCEDIGVAMVTNMISQLQESFPSHARGWFFWNFIHKMSKMASKCEHGRVTGDFLD